MAVIISNGNTSLSTASGFYRVEAGNIYAGYSYIKSISTLYSWDTTFANTGNCQGLGLGLFNIAATFDGGVTVGLQEKIGTFTTTIATPAIFTLTSHGLVEGDEVLLTTTGSLPTGLTKDTALYYVSPTEVTPRNMTSDSLPSPFVASASSYNGVGYEPYRAFDGSTGTLWRTNSIPTGWLKLDFGSTKTVTKYSIYNFVSVQNPKDWTFEGSNDDSSWDILDTQTNIVWTGTSTKTFSFSNTTAYRYYRINVSANNGGAYVYIYGFNMFEFNANTFCLVTNTSDTDVVATSGSQSGTHTLLATRAKDDFAQSTFSGETGLINGFVLYKSFPFITPYAIDTTVGKWKFYAKQYATTSSYLSLIFSDNITYVYPAYWSWCDNAVTFTDNDTIICKDVVTIDKSATLGNILPVSGYTNWGVCGIVESSTGTSEDTICNLRWENIPAASYTLTLKGNLYFPSYSGFQIGSSANPIPANKQAIIINDTPIVGTFTVSNIMGAFGTSTTAIVGKGSMVWYGEIPTDRVATLSVDAELSQAHLITVEDMSAIWQIGDRLGVGRQNHMGSGSYAVMEILSISGTDITLTANVPSYKRFAGAKIINLSRKYGIEMKGATTGTANARLALYCLFNKPIFLKVSGVYFRDVFSTGNTYYSTYQATQSRFAEKALFNDTLSEYTYVSSSFAASPAGIDIIPVLGMDVKRNLVWGGVPIAYIGASYTSGFKSGRLTIEDNISSAMGSNCLALCWQNTLNTKVTVKNNIFDNKSSSLYPILMVTGKNWIIEGNSFFGCNATASSQSGGAVAFGTLALKPVFRNNSYDFCANAIGWYTAGFLSGGVSKGDKFGQLQANTYDVGYKTGTYGTLSISDSVGLIHEDVTELPDTTAGTRVGISNENSVQYVDRSSLTEGYYTRCGIGLADTTAYNPTGYSMRFESNISELAWEQIIPTGDITGLAMSINIRVKINSANYYSGIYSKPKVTVLFDGETETYVEADNTTDWQLLNVTFTPTTSYPEITLTITTETDKTGSDAYVYWDSISVLYPPTVSLNLGSLDLWSGGRPVTPSISTAINVADVWNYPTTNLTAPGTTGKKLVDDLTTSKFLGLK